MPNFQLLNNAIAQKQKDIKQLNKDNWLETIYQKIQALKWKDVENDIIPFLEFDAERLAFTQENLHLSLSG